MLKKFSKEMEVKASASEVWDVYSSKKLGMIINSAIGHLFDIKILQGQGGVGTILKFTPLSDASKVPEYKERFTKVDHENRVKEVEVFEGGYLEFGLSSYRMRTEILEKNSEDSCVVRTTIEYEAEEDVIANVDEEVTITSVMNVYEFANRYIENNK